MKLKNVLFYFTFSMLFFTSFVSENKSKVFEKIIPQKKEALIKEKKQKLNFKERLALKLVKKKIKKVQKKQAKSIKSKKYDGTNIALLLSILLILGGLIGGIIALALGETLLGILLLVGGLIFIPIILIIILINVSSF